ncbi:hypothetical protein IU443_28110 [Nocardia farcinica]|uniref:hypothetical protein n=1 Tax=Nocardia farcinica TaxID=37329 RepID=UPI001894638F|nr:hypothetical protein [Nocardia farcinica]MBF6393796.1 hypothetical protein [Nocardia farcinica]MBF6411256.1 hypothetical protein [Nocardia farcinica]MCZ9330287.1 hypothetical protein [Nocardia farcinica]UEX26209.1 hypothetical protein LMJ57_30120 [Nocardia farcinica]
MTSTSTRRLTVAETVRADEAALKAMKTHGELYQWAKEHDLTGGKFAAVKKQWKAIGIDYDAIREEVTRQRLAELNAAAAEGVPAIRLSAAGDGNVNSYAVCDSEGTVLWYGTFHERDRYYRNGDQVSADASAANKAIFLAGQARQLAKVELARLELTLTNPHVDTAQLIREATSWRLLLDIQIADDPNDPPAAVAWCEEPGFQDWKDADLRSLVEADDQGEGAE